MSILIDIRDEIHTRIALKRTLEEFTFNDFTLVKTWYPFQKLELMGDHPGGKVYIIGLAGDDAPNQSRSNVALREVPVQIGYQKPISNLQDTDSIDDLILFVEQLRDVCRKDVDLDGYSWSRNESLKDENGIPYSFVGMREASLFESYFTAFYQTVLA